MVDKLKESTIHRIFKALSPNRIVKSDKKGERAIIRSTTPEAISYVTSYLNNHLKAIIEACEQSLSEINSNPNSYYQQHRYDIQVVKLAIHKVEEDNK